MAQIARESVAEIYHRVDVEMPAQPPRFLEPWFEVEMFGVNRSAELARGENCVTGFRAGAKNTFLLFHRPDRCDGDQHPFGIRRCLAADDGDTDRKSTRLNSSHVSESRMPSFA